MRSIAILTLLISLHAAHALADAPSPDVAPAPALTQPEPADPALAPREQRWLLYRSELAQIDERLNVLQAERAEYGIAVPIALMGAGFGAALGLAYVAFLHFIVTSNDGYENERSTSEIRTGRTLLGLSVAGVGVGVVGGVMLGRSLHGRALYRPELRSLKQRRRQLMDTLRYSALVTPEGPLGLSVEGRF